MKRFGVVLTQLYPATWRERYGEEFEALLAQCPANPRMVANTAAGAAGAWLRWPVLASSASARLRGALTAVLWGGLAVLWVTSGFVKAEIPATDPSVRALGVAVTWAAAAAAATMGAGAVVPAIAVARSAVAWRRPDVLRLMAAPPLAGLAFVGFAAALAAWGRHANLPAPLGHTLFYVIAALFLAATIVTGRAPSAALRRMDPGERPLRAAVPFAVAVVIALAVTTALMAAYTIALDQHEPWLAHSGYGPPWWHLVLLAQLIIDAAAMGLGTLIAGAGLAQGTLIRRAGE